MSTPYGYIVTVECNVITIRVRPGLGASMNGNNRLQPVINSPKITATKLLPFTGQVGLISASQFFEISGTTLYGFPGSIAINSPSPNFQVSNDNITFGASTIVQFTSDTIHNIKVYVRYTPQVAGNSTTNIQILGGGLIIPVEVLAEGTAIGAAAISATPLNPFPSTPVGGISPVQISNLTGSNLIGAPGNITVTAPNNNFQVSSNGSNWGSSATIQFANPNLSSTPIYVRFTPQTTGSQSGNLSISGGGVNTSVGVSGTGAVPTLTATPVTAFPNTVPGNASPVKTFTLSGVNLTNAPGNINLTAPANFQISPDGIAAWGNSLVVPYGTSTLASTTIYVRFVPTSTGTKSGNISISGGGATTSVSLTGVGVVEFIIKATGLTSIKFNNIKTANGFTMLWDVNNLASAQNFPSGSSGVILRSYSPPYTGDIKLQVTNYADVEEFDISGGNTESPQPPGANRIVIQQVELVKLSNLLKFKVAQNVLVTGITTLNLNRSLRETQIYFSDITGDIANIPPQSELIDFRSSTAPGNAITGSINTMYANVAAAGATLKFFWMSVTNNMTGNISSIPNSATAFVTTDNNTITGDFSSLAGKSSLLYFVVNGANTISGNINNINYTSLLWLEVGGTGAKTGNISTISFNPAMFAFSLPSNSSGVVGNISNLPNNINFLNLAECSVAGTTSDVPTSCGTLVMGVNSTLIDPVNLLPPSLFQLVVQGNNHGISGTFNDLPPNLRVVNIVGDNHTVGGYPSGKTWGQPSGSDRIMNYFNVQGASAPSLSVQSQVNQLLIDLNAVTIWQQTSSFVTFNPSITYKGIAPNGAGLTAKTNLISRGVNPVANV